MDGMRARRGQPQAANHWCFNRHLNAVNLAPGNGGAGLWEKTKQNTQTLGKRRRFVFFVFFLRKGKMKKMKKRKVFRKLQLSAACHR